jgi:antitoxin ParD1/3/4
MPTVTKQLNVSITPHFAKFISANVKSGRYGNTSEVVREALRRFEQDEQIREQDALDPDNAQEAVAKGFASIERGAYIDIDGDRQLRSFFADVAARGKERVVASKRATRK